MQRVEFPVEPGLAEPEPVQQRLRRRQNTLLVINVAVLAVAIVGAVCWWWLGPGSQPFGNGFEKW